MTDKYIREDGKIAVLISPGYGAGWSTWADDEHREFLLFDRGLVELALSISDNHAVKQYLERTGLHDVYLGGWEQVYVKWVNPGTHFMVYEYDGSEAIRLIKDVAVTA